MGDAEADTAAQVIDGFLADTRSKDLVDAYFNPDSTFAGDLFDTLGARAPYEVTRDDLLAVTLLDVRFGPRAVRALLGPLAEDITGHLQAIDPALRLWTATQSCLDGAVTALWTMLRSVPGVGPVTAGKLLARKRPHLVPIVDSAVVRVLGPQRDGYWRAIQAALTDGERRSRLEALRNVASLSTLRLLDILLWMHGSESTSARQVRTALGLPVAPRGNRTGSPDRQSST